MSNNRHPIQRLQLALLSESASGETMKFQIGAQSYRNKDFGFDGAFYSDSASLHIKSATQPDWNPSGDNYTFYVRGDDTDYDEEIMTATVKDWGRIVSAVQEFNRTFKGTPSAVIDRTE
jgi:hypothetical protein